MNKLGPLDIMGTLSPCNKSVRVKQQVIGATVELRVGPTAVGGGPATWPEQSFTLTQELKAGDTLTAVQTRAGFLASDPVNTLVGPLPTPALLSNGQFFTPFYVCGQCVWLSGLFAGALVEVLTHGQPLGKAQVRDDGQVHVDLIRPLNSEDRLTARQTACLNIQTPAATPISGGAPQPLPALPPPTVAPAFICDRAIDVTGVTPSSQVSVWRGGKLIGDFCCATARLLLTNQPPLHLPPDDVLEARVAFPPCKQTSPKSAKTSVQARNPPAPTILPPLCEGQTFVNLDGLRPGATVELTVNGITLVFGAPDASVPNYHPVPPLVAGTAVTARQNTCGDTASWSMSSPPTTLVGSGKPVKPTLLAPLDNAPDVALKPTLFWTDPGSTCNFANTFDIQLATDAAFTANLQTANGVSPHQYTPASNLQYATKYYWRIKSHRGAQVTAWSAPFHFTTVKKGGHPGGNGPPPPNDNDIERERCFLEDCCAKGSYKKVITVFGTHNAAYAKAVANSPDCTIEPLEVLCNSKPGYCGG